MSLFPLAGRSVSRHTGGWILPARASRSVSMVIPEMLTSTVVSSRARRVVSGMAAAGPAVTVMQAAAPGQFAWTEVSAG